MGYFGIRKSGAKSDKDVAAIAKNSTAEKAPTPCDPKLASNSQASDASDDEDEYEFVKGDEDAAAFTKKDIPFVSDATQKRINAPPQAKKIAVAPEPKSASTQTSPMLPPNGLSQAQRLEDHVAEVKMLRPPRDQSSNSGGCSRKANERLISPKIRLNYLPSDHQATGTRPAAPCSVFSGHQNIVGTDKLYAAGKLRDFFRTMQEQGLMNMPPPLAQNGTSRAVPLAFGARAGRQGAANRGAAASGRLATCQSSIPLQYELLTGKKPRSPRSLWEDLMKRQKGGVAPGPSDTARRKTVTPKARSGVRLAPMRNSIPRSLSR